MLMQIPLPVTVNPAPSYDPNIGFGANLALAGANGLMAGTQAIASGLFTQAGVALVELASRGAASAYDTMSDAVNNAAGAVGSLFESEKPVNVVSGTPAELKDAVLAAYDRGETVQFIVTDDNKSAISAFATAAADGIPVNRAPAPDPSTTITIQHGAPLPAAN